MQYLREQDTHSTGDRGWIPAKHGQRGDRLSWSKMLRRLLLRGDGTDSSWRNFYQMAEPPLTPAATSRPERSSDGSDRCLFRSRDENSHWSHVHRGWCVHRRTVTVNDGAASASDRSVEADDYRERGDRGDLWTRWRHRRRFRPSRASALTASPVRISHVPSTAMATEASCHRSSGELFTLSRTCLEVGITHGDAVSSARDEFGGEGSDTFELTVRGT